MESPNAELDQGLQGLLSFERLDRTSPDLWPEQIPGVSDFASLAASPYSLASSPPKWLAELEKDDMDMLQETAQLVVPLVMASLVLVAVAVILYCRRRSSMKHAKYSGVSVQVGNPSFLYEDMLDEDSTAGNPDFSWNDSHKATNFSNPVYESVFHADSSVGTDLYEGEHKVSFRNGRVDFSNPVYEALFARERRVKSDPSLKGSTTTLKSTVELSSSQESNC